jgi:hypothetical protein
MRQLVRCINTVGEPVDDGIRILQFKGEHTHYVCDKREHYPQETKGKECSVVILTIPIKIRKDKTHNKMNTGNFLDFVLVV